MSVDNKLNPLDEALRILWIESIPNSNEETSSRELRLILSDNDGPDMDAQKQLELINRLFETVKSVSLGELIDNALATKNISSVELADESGLDVSSVEELKEDSIYPNNIPVILLQKLLEKLNISFDTVEKAIWKTYEMLRKKYFIEPGPGYVFARKGRNEIREGLINKKTTGRELYENKDALEKYLSKLKDLMEENK